MLSEGIKQSDGKLQGLAVDDDGKLLVGGITVSDITVTDVEISNDTGNPVPVSGPLTDTELRATALPVSGPVTDTELRATALPVSGPLTDTQIRATALPVSGPVTNTELRAAPVPVSQPAASVGVNLTRPADTTAYAAKDVISNSTSAPAVITFAGMGRVNAGTGVITRARLMTSQKTCTAQFRLHLFHTAPTAINDNSPYTMLYANAANRIGMIDFPALATEDPTNSTAAGSMRPSSDGSYGPPSLWYKCAAADTALYGILETLSAFTPDNAQLFYIELGAYLD